MREGKLRVMIRALLILGVCLVASIGLLVAPGGESLELLLSGVIGGAVIGGLIGVSVSVIFLLAATVWMAGRKRTAFILAIVLTIGLGLLLYFTFRRVPVECEQIQESELRALLGSGPVSTSVAKQWLHNSPFKEVEITGADYYDGKKVVQWHTNKAAYSANFHDDSLTAVNVDWRVGSKWDDLEPTGDEVLTCFGSPDLYQARYFVDLNGEFVDLSLWYLKKGIVVSSQIPYKWQPPIIDGNVIMTGMQIVAPNSAEKMVRDVYVFAEEEDDFQAEILETLYPWPSTWAETVIDTTHPSP